MHLSSAAIHSQQTEMGNAAKSCCSEQCWHEQYPGQRVKVYVHSIVSCAAHTADKPGRSKQLKSTHVAQSHARLVYTSQAKRPGTVCTERCKGCSGTHVSFSSKHSMHRCEAQLVYPILKAKSQNQRQTSSIEVHPWKPVLNSLLVTCQQSFGQQALASAKSCCLLRPVCFVTVADPSSANS